MRTTVVPAQITSVEDRIADNLSFKQLLLLISPVFVSAGLMVFLPPFASFKVYKLIISIVFALLCITLAVRIKGKLVVEWIVILARFNLRPRFYVFNKNDMHSRHLPKETSAITPRPVQKTRLMPITRQAFEAAKVLQFEQVVSDPQMDFRFSTKKGGLRVHIKEIK